MLKNYLNTFDPRKIFILSILVLCVLGLLMVFSSSSVSGMEHHGDYLYFLKRQSFFLLVGLIFFFVCSKIDTDLIEKKYKLFYLVGIVMLLLVFVPILGKTAGGGTRWINLIAFSFQPIEITKYMLLIFMAQHLAKKGTRIREFKIGVVSSILPFIPYAVLLSMQPDFGNLVLLGATIFTMIIISGARFSHIFSIFVLLSASFVSLIWIAPYRMKRLLAFLDPYGDPEGSGWQIIQSYIALAKGQWFGVGLGNSTQKLFFLPHQHNDFIFSIIAEELGIIGSSIFILLFVCLIYSGFKMIDRAKDMFIRNLMAGIVIITSLQIIINISVTVGLLPTKGMPLPFISYGGSSLVFTLMSMGLILALDKKRK
tara:strand:+ start:1233 stop:2339 length:1107 start_codon:yes stop_codon:yes gene_type:complete